MHRMKGLLEFHVCIAHMEPHYTKFKTVHEKLSAKIITQN